MPFDYERRELLITQQFGKHVSCLYFLLGYCDYAKDARILDGTSYFPSP